MIKNKWYKRQEKYEAKFNLDKNFVIDFCAIESQEFQPNPLLDKPHGGIS